MRVIRSMTGFGRSEKTAGGFEIVVEIRSVNHRFFEYTSRITRGYGFLDEKLKAYLQERISRGKVDAMVSVETVGDTDAQVLVNHSLAAGYAGALRELKERCGLSGEVTLDSVARYSDIFTVRREPEDEDRVWESVRETAEEAVSSLVGMRESEGKHLKADFLARSEKILATVAKIEERSPRTVSEYQQKLRERLKSMLADANVDEQRLLTEAAVYADKISVTEETVRLRSHIRQFRSLLETDGPVGRKLDFLVQEMNREANTIGSKCADAEIAYEVVDVKAEIEKLREQIQNIE